MKFKVFEKLKQNSTPFLMVSCMETESGLGEFEYLWHAEGGIFGSLKKFCKKNIPYWIFHLLFYIMWLWNRVVYGIGVTFVQPVYYSSFFSRERIYGYGNDFERFVDSYFIMFIDIQAWTGFAFLSFSFSSEYLFFLYNYWLFFG